MLYLLSPRSTRFLSRLGSMDTVALANSSVSPGALRRAIIHFFLTLRYEQIPHAMGGITMGKNISGARSCNNSVLMKYSGVYDSMAFNCTRATFGNNHDRLMLASIVSIVVQMQILVVPRASHGTK